MRNPAPHTPQLKERGGGADSRMQQSVIKPRNCGMACEGFLCIKEGQNAVRFSVLVFCVWEKDRMLCIFSFLVLGVESQVRQQDI